GLHGGDARSHRGDDHGGSRRLGRRDDERGAPPRSGQPAAGAAFRACRRCWLARRLAPSGCGVSLRAVGAYKARQTTSPLLRSALELMTIGLVSAFIAWGIGKLFEAG